MKKLVSIIICSMFLISCSASYRAQIKTNMATIKEKNRVKKATHLAKNAYTLLCEFTNPPYTEEDLYWTNENFIKRIIRNIKGPIRTYDWITMKYNNQTYIVFYPIEAINSNNNLIFYFDVNLKTKIVRHIPQEQWQSYGLP